MMINIYPGARQILAHPTNYKTCVPKRGTFALVVLHITDGGPKAEKTAAYFATPYSTPGGPKGPVSAHFVIGQDGTVVQCVDLGDVAYHARGVNAVSVGIEHCARSKGELGNNDPGLPMTEVQYRASARLTAWLCRAAGLPLTRDYVKGHAEVAPQDDHPDCPTGQLDWSKYMQYAEQAARDLAAELLR